MTRRPSEPVVLIELVRFLCALAVMGCHYGVGFWRMPGVQPARLLAGITYRSPAEQWLQFGWLGVEIFFVISGLVIMRSASASSAAVFVRQRVLRLAPAAWVCATLSLIVVGTVGGFDRELWAGWARSVAFWPWGRPVDGSYWTLGIELAFYTAVALALAGSGGVRRVERLAVAIGGASLAFWIGCALAGAPGAALVNTRAAQLLLLTYGCFFALGALIARCQADGVTPARLLTIGAALCGALAEVAVHAIEHSNDTGLPRAIGTALALFAAVVAVLAVAPRAQRPLASLIRPKTARLIGIATYPLYLIHQDAGAAMTATFVRAGASPGLALLGAAALSLTTALLVAMTAEPALRDWLARQVSRGPRADSLRTASLPNG